MSQLSEEVPLTLSASHVGSLDMSTLTQALHIESLRLVRSHISKAAAWKMLNGILGLEIRL